MVRRNERPTWEETDRRRIDRRQAVRRKSDQWLTWSRYLVIAVLAVVLYEFFRR